LIPTVFKWKGYRFYFFSREERRPHIHVFCGDGEAKFWVQPDVEMPKNYRLSATQLAELEKIIREKRNEIINAWDRHFPGGSH
jgi:hypothetical protein